MIWKILRPHFWMLDRRVRQTNRVLIIALLAGVPFLVQWIWTNLIADQLALLTPDQLATFIASFIPMGLLLMVSFTLLGVGDVMNQLYLVSDLELLLVAPVRQRTIFVVKLLQCSRATFIPALLLGAVFFALGYAWNAALSYYLLFTSLLLAGMVLATALVMILVMIIARVLPARYIRTWMPVAIGLAMMAIVIGQQSLMLWFSTRTGLMTRLSEAVTSPERLAVVVLVVGGGALLTGLVAYYIFVTSFHEGWGRFREVPAQRKPAMAGSRRGWGIYRMLRSLREPLKSFLVKEGLELRRDPQMLMSIANPLLMMLVLVLIPANTMRSGGEVLQPLYFWFMLMVIALMAGILPVGTAMMSVAQEGRQMALLRAAPISMASMLRGKYWASLVPMALSWMLVLLASGILLRLPAWQVCTLVGVTLLGSSGATLTALTIGGLKIDFDAEELKQRVPMLMSYVTMALNTVFFLLTIGVGIWLAIRFLPDSSVDAAAAVLNNLPTGRWLLSDSLWIPIVLIASQVAFWVGARLIWTAAVRRLENWEGG
jgi:hypothetical protein